MRSHAYQHYVVCLQFNMVDVLIGKCVYFKDKQFFTSQKIRTYNFVITISMAFVAQSAVTLNAIKPQTIECSRLNRMSRMHFGNFHFVHSNFHKQIIPVQYFDLIWFLLRFKHTSNGELVCIGFSMEKYL